jgi:SAM-dependent methyltransferase
VGEYLHCLDLISGIPYFRDIKEQMLRFIVERSPKRILDAGCGPGTDLVSLAPRLPGSCHIVGLDASRAFLRMAAERTFAFRDRCFLVQGDVLDIPLVDSIFEACRIDRVLQHIREPSRTVTELFRVLVPGGILVAFDNDWDTFVIGLDNDDLARRLLQFWRDSFASGRIGRDLPLLLCQCGLLNVHSEPRTLVLTDLTIASQVFNIPVLIERTRSAGVLTPDETAAVWQELLQRSEEGTFFSRYTGYLVQGTKP